MPNHKSDTEEAAVIVAHRGMSATFPENTHTAIAAAITSGATAVEFDIQITADNEIVLGHNPTLDYYGFPDVAVATSTLQELQSYDIGRIHGKKFVGEQVASFQKILQEFGDQVTMMVEFKTKYMSDRQIDTLITRFLQLTSGQHDKLRLQALCFKPHVLERLHATANWLPLVWNTNYPHRLHSSDLTRQPWLSGVGCRIGRTDRNSAALIQQSGMNLYSFTCNTTDEVLKARDLGAAAIISDNHIQARDLLAAADIEECASLPQSSSLSR